MCVHENVEEKKTGFWDACDQDERFKSISSVFLFSLFLLQLHCHSQLTYMSNLLH